MNILGLIPARGGSKSIPQKNITPLAGRPLIAYSIQAALESTTLNRVVVSTDDDEIRDVSRKLGAEVPFMRPESISGDEAPAQSVIKHAVGYLERCDNWKVDYVVYLQPTSPFRNSHHIDQGVRLIEESGAHTLVSVVAVPHRFSPDSLMVLNADRTLSAGAGEQVLRRQDKQCLYARNGPAVLILKRECVADDKLYTRRTVGMVMDWLSSIDIDSPDDLAVAERLMHQPDPG
jgi:CMP-N-acetylneuraminic acid synthetase